MAVGALMSLTDRERILVVETTQAMHESRIYRLERFQVTILVASLFAAIGGCGSLIMFILARGH